MIVREFLTSFGIETDDRKLESFDRQIKDVRRNLMRATAAVAGASAAIFGLANSSARAGDEIAKNAREAGVLADTYQALTHGGELFGLEQSAINSGLQAFSRRVGRAARDSGPAVEAFQELGVSVRDANGNLRDNDSVLRDVMDAFNGIEDASTRTTIAQDLFSRSGRRMTSFLAQGSGAIDEFRQELEDHGDLLDTDALDASEAFMDAQTRMKSVMRGLKNELGIGLLPVLTELIEDTREWIIENRELLRMGLTRFLRGLITVLQQLGRFMGAVASGADNVAQALGGWDRTLRLVTALIGTMLGFRLVRWFGTLARAIGAAGGAMAVLRTAMMRIPFVALAVGIAMLIEDIWSWVEGNDSAIGHVLGSWDNFKANWSQLWDDLKNDPAQVWEVVKLMAADAMAAVWDSILWWWDQYTALMGRVEGVFIEGFQAAGEWLGQWLNSVRDAFVETFDRIGDWLRDWAGRIRDGITGIIPNWMRRAFETGTTWIPGIGGDDDSSEPDLSGERRASTGGGGQGGDVNVTIDENVSISVPSGTSQEQARAIDEQARASIRDQFQRELRRAMLAFPED